MKSLQAIHAVLLCMLFALPLLIPALRPWPLYQLAPLTVYAVIVAVVPPLRRGVGWLRVGRLDGVVLGWTAAVIVVSSAALVLWFLLARPDVGDLVAMIPHVGGAELVLIGAGFSVLNALMEEAVFRGVLQEALTAEWGPWWAVGIQGVLFGVVHAPRLPAQRGGDGHGVGLRRRAGAATAALRRHGGVVRGPCLCGRDDLRAACFAAGNLTADGLPENLSRHVFHDLIQCFDKHLNVLRVKAKAERGPRLWPDDEKTP